MKNNLIRKVRVGGKKIKNLLSRKKRSHKKYTYMLLSLIPIVLFQNCEQSSSIKSVSDAVQVVSSSRSQPATPAPSPSSSPTPTATPGPVASPTPTPTPVLTKSMEKTFEFATKNKVDILFVVDNSGSMAAEQSQMANHVKDMVSIIHNLDWQVAITTTDPSPDKYYGDGQLVPFKGMASTQVLKKGDLLNEQEASAVIANTLQRSESGSGAEQGIKATYRAIQRAIQDRKSANASLFRSDADIAVVLISDENESLSEATNKPQTLVDLVKLEWPSKKMNFHSIIVRPNDTVCFGKQSPTGGVYGTAYDALSKLLRAGQPGGSIIGDICADDYTAQLQNIGYNQDVTSRSLQLDCSPLSMSPISIMKDGVPYTEAYSLTNDTLTFQNYLPSGIYKVSYQCRL